VGALWRSPPRRTTSSDATIRGQGPSRMRVVFTTWRTGALLAAHVGRHRSSLIDCPVRRSQMSYRSACHRRQVIVPRRARARRKSVSERTRARTLSAASPDTRGDLARSRAAAGPPRSGDLSPPLSPRQIGFSSLDLSGCGGWIGPDSSQRLSAPAARSLTINTNGN
jgi:hypothetical protein